MYFKIEVLHQPRLKVSYARLDRFPANLKLRFLSRSGGRNRKLRAKFQAKFQHNFAYHAKTKAKCLYSLTALPILASRLN